MSLEFRAKPKPALWEKFAKYGISVNELLERLMNKRSAAIPTAGSDPQP
jgi:hypothetical protein